ncbi:MAG TPA: SpoIIE family protein phosphatase [Vicinamibacterales bacterium]|nr:SpoIIE family protein phosphatase [Vicinamibacterales bacterium]
MIRAVLVDDEPPARQRMRQLLDAAADVTIVGEAGSAVEARDVIRRTRPDLLFLDVEMPEVRGTALAAELPEPRPFIVFATAFDHYALDAIAVDATDYLLKPVSRTKLAATLDRVRARLARQRVEHDVVAASVVQAHMWPVALPGIPGFDCAAASLPARGVGGDFYDVFPIGDAGRWGLLLGDASGKGVAAGLVASAVQARVNAAARHALLAPDQLMAAVDRDVYGTTDGARYATAIYGSLDTTRRELTFVNAGHPALLVLPPGGAVERYGATGPALGLIEAGRFESRSIALPPGAILLAVTDGVTEAQDEHGSEFGDDVLGGLLAASRHLPAAQLCETVLAAVRTHRGTRQDQDDVTVMAVKVQ